MNTLNARERAQQASAEMSMVLEGPKRISDRAPQIDESLVEEMCAHLLAEKQRELRGIPAELLPNVLPPVYFEDGGKRQAKTREDFERLLRPWKYELGRLMLKVPRNKDETFKDYFPRLRKDVGDMDGWWGRFERMKIFLAHLRRIEIDEEDDAYDEQQRAKREAEARRERERARRAELEKQATVDAKEVKRLLAVIVEAEEIEALLRKANNARTALRTIYAKERDACVALGRPVPEREVPEGVGDNGYALGCQSARNFDPVSACNLDPSIE
jgi:hypothetical protein